MSYILDALKKAEHERDLGRVPRLESMQDSAPRRSRALPWLIGGIVLVNAAALLWWLRPGAPIVVARSVPQVAPASTPSPSVPAAPAVPVAPPIVVPPIAAAPIATTPPQEPVAAPVAPAVPEAVDDRPALVSVPLLRDLPADFRAAVPPINLDVHVYASSPAGRFVLINMKKYHEGDQLAEGPRIEEITEAGVVMNYQGQMFRIARH